jgi:predicted nucleotide-binding protein (sugar kinase/HSP70/actin superfamily)
MSRVGARLTAAGLRSIGIDAQPAPDSDAETLELGGAYSSGEECLPHRITLGDFLKVTRQPDFVAGQTAFFMPTACGPCRFGQYAPYLRKVLAELGHGDVLVFSPSSTSGYDEVGFAAPAAQLTLWMGLVLGDLLTRFVLKTRPYELTAGDADAAHNASLAEFEEILAVSGITAKRRLRRLVSCVENMRDRFRAVPANYEMGKPLIGLVGEIFCRQNTFSNDDIARRVERLGGECRLSDITEWVWYANWYQDRHIRRTKGRFHLDRLMAHIKTRTQRHYEHALLTPVGEDLIGYEEPENVREVLDRSAPYLPADGCIGEMVLSIGKAIHLAEQGAAGIVDISPFTCMNGVVCEGIYPAVSAAHDGLPIRVLYFDGVAANVDQHLEIFLDLARDHQHRSHYARKYPAYFCDRIRSAGEAGLRD